jgi:hypothetical protein
MAHLYTVIVVVSLTTFLAGIFLADFYHFLKFGKKIWDEKTAYRTGWLDGVYYATQETTPNEIYEELATRAYQEYKGIRHGPTKH